jgi:hypothetical protein
MEMAHGQEGRAANRRRIAPGFRPARRMLIAPCMKRPHISQIGSTVASFIFSGALLGACATSGTDPHAMTAGQHEAAATAEGRLVSWQSPEKEADAHRKLAHEHRAASQALRATEQRSCSGISEADRDFSPFSHRGDIASIDDINERSSTYGAASSTYGSGPQVRGQPIGSHIVFRAVPGMTKEWLQREVDCHLARNQVMGESDQSMAFCPLAVAHVSASVSSTGNGFAVDVTSTNGDSIKEIIRRAQALKPGE